jgi:Na+/H+ antiporter NhaD/arsenite permease-like protein
MYPEDKGEGEDDDDDDDGEGKGVTFRHFYFRYFYLSIFSLSTFLLSTFFFRPKFRESLHYNLSNQSQEKIIQAIAVSQK